MKEKIIYNLKMVIILSGAVLFIAVMVWFLVGLERTRVSTNDQRLRNVRQSVVNGAVLCYSVEGVYPESLDYLKENYGLEYDENRYLVHYKYVSADIRPSIMVYDNDKPTEQGAV